MGKQAKSQIMLQQIYKQTWKSEVMLLPLITGTPSLSVTTIAWSPSTLMMERKDQLLLRMQNEENWCKIQDESFYLGSCLYK